MVPTRYPVVAGLLAGVVTLRHRLVTFVHAWIDVDATTVAVYYSVTAWLAFLLVPVGALAVGYAGGRTAAEDPDSDPLRTGLRCLAVGLAVAVLAVAVGVVLRPDSVGPAAISLVQLGSYAFSVVRPPVLAAVAVVAGVTLGADRAGA